MAATPEIVRSIVEAEGQILSVNVLRPSLEEAYLKLIKGGPNTMNIHKAWLVFKKDWLRNQTQLASTPTNNHPANHIFSNLSSNTAGNLKYTHNKHVNIRFPIANTQTFPRTYKRKLHSLAQTKS